MTVSTFPTTRPILCAITDRRLLAGGAGAAAGASTASTLAASSVDTRAACDALVAYASEAAEAGIDLLQVREPDLDDVTLLRLVEQICDATRGSSTRVLVNDRVDIALAAGAAGVHLRGSSYPAARARTLLGDAAIVGRSVHEASEAAAVDAAGGLDYLIFGTVFATRSKPEGHRLAGLEGLAAAVRACRRPVLAIGGVREEHIHQIAQTGAAGVAAIALFSGAASARSGASASTGGTARPLRLLAQRLRLTYNP